MRRVSRLRTAAAWCEKWQASRPYIGAGLDEAARRLVEDLHHLHCLARPVENDATEAILPAR